LICTFSNLELYTLMQLLCSFLVGTTLFVRLKITWIPWSNWMNVWIQAKLYILSYHLWNDHYVENAGTPDGTTCLTCYAKENKVYLLGHKDKRLLKFQGLNINFILLAMQKICNCSMSRKTWSITHWSTRGPRPQTTDAVARLWPLLHQSWQHSHFSAKLQLFHRGTRIFVHVLLCVRCAIP